MTDDRELRWDLPWDDTAPAQARRLLSSALGPFAPDDLLLIASELVTNAYRHGLAPLLLCARQDDSRVEVSADGAWPWSISWPTPGSGRNQRVDCGSARSCACANSHVTVAMPRRASRAATEFLRG